jgi:hypothetical protein
MGHRRWWLAGAVLVTLAGCSTGGTANPAQATSTPPSAAATTPLPPTIEPLPTPTVAPTTPAPAPPVPALPPPGTTAPAVPDPLAFFRAQEAPCQQFAQQIGNPVVEPDRFSGAKVVRDLGKGATQIVDGRGTRLVVVPKRGIVLPESGRTDDAMPLPYEFGCSEKIFVGAAHD